MVCVAQCSLYFNNMQQVCCVCTSLCQPTPLFSTLGFHILSCNTTAKMPLTWVPQFPDHCPPSLYVKSQIVCKIVSSWCYSWILDYSTCPSVKVPVAPFFTVSTSNPVLCNKPPPRGPPLSPSLLLGFVPSSQCSLPHRGCTHSSRE